MPICASASLASPVLRRLGGAPGEALQRHIQHLLLDACERCRKAQLLQRLDADTDLARGLADRICRSERASGQTGEAADHRSADQRATESTNPRAQALRLASQPLQPARGALARAHHPPGTHLLARALELMHAKIGELEQAANQAARPRRDHHAIWFRQNLQAGGQIGRLAHDRLFLRRCFADQVADHYTACRDSDPRAELSTTGR